MPLRVKLAVVENILGEKQYYQKDLLRQVTYKKNDMKEFRRAYKMIARALSNKKTSHNSFQGHSGSFSSQQKCVVKMRYGNTVEKHMRFLQEYLTQENKKEVVEKPSLFSSPNTNMKKYLSEYQAAMDSKHFKFIISPESPNVDCKVLTENLVARIETLTGYKFHWLAAVHTNTAHPHAHLLINGIDKNGKNIDCFRGAFLTQTVRDLSRQLCTEMIGSRTREQIEADIKGIPRRAGYTVIDETISLYQSQRHTDENAHIYPTQIICRDDTMYRRLSFLQELGFAQKDMNLQNTFYLEKNWQEKLKAAGRYNSFLKARDELSLTHKESLELFTKDTEPIAGVITKIFRMNYEESWNNAMLIEDRKNGKAYYVPIYGDVSDKMYEKLLHAEVECKGEYKGNSFKPKIKVTKWESPLIQ